MIFALAGRRVDAPDASAARFPPENASLVASRIAELFAAKHATTLVCAAACGADLLALDAARRLGLACHIVLPYPKDRFRATSVTDRPGDWGALFDDAIARAEAAGALLELNLPEADEASFLAGNRAILDRASALARAAAEPVEAVLVWNGQSRDELDVTAAFGEEAKSLGIPLSEILTTAGYASA
jgi:hypothetical protein